MQSRCCCLVGTEVQSVVSFFLVPVLIIWELFVFNGKILRQLFLFKFYIQNATAAKRSSN